LFSFYTDTAHTKKPAKALFHVLCMGLGTKLTTVCHWTPHPCTFKWPGADFEGLRENRTPL